MKHVEYFTDSLGKYRFRITAANGEILAASEAYESKQAAENGVKAIQEALTPQEPVSTPSGSNKTR